MKNRRLSNSVPPDVLADPVAPPFHQGEPSVPARASDPWVGLLRTAAGFTLVAAISLVVAWGARRHLTTSPRFALEQVVIEGQKTRTKEALLSRAHVEMGQNVFSIDLDAARTKMLSDPYVKSASLVRRLPDTILVRIEERVPAAIVVIGSDAYLVTREGETFKRVEVGDPPDLPVITGVRPELVESDSEGFAEAIRRALDVAVDYQQSSLATKMALQEVHVDAWGTAMAMTLTVGSPNRDGVVSLVLGGPPFRRKLEQAARVSAELERRGQKPDAILLDQGARPEHVVARVR